MSAVRYTSYPSAPTVKDPIFIFCNSSGSQKGALTAVSPGGTGPFDFTWHKWNDITKTFSDFIKTETGVMTSSLTNLSEGGYSVTISGDYNSTLTGWILFDKPPFAEAKLQQQLCERVALNGDTAGSVHEFYYRDISNGSSVTLKNELTFLWSSIPSTYIPSPDLFLDPIIVNTPPPNRIYRLPLEDVTFKLKVNSIGCSSESSFFYESIHVKADFTLAPDKGEAPLEVTFTDKSVRGSIYKWEFGDGKDSISDLITPDPHTYYKPGKYSVKLTIESDRRCIDTMRFDYIEVEKSSLAIPNVFTPDGDGLNDKFVVESKSLRMLNVEVFSRSGVKVYSFNGTEKTLRDWEGWDGNVNNSSQKATPGVYFYLIRAYGWDDIEYDGDEYRGFVHLYR